MNFDIKFDFQRRERLGLIEAIWGTDKSIDQLKRLSESVLSKNEVVLPEPCSPKINRLTGLDDFKFISSFLLPNKFINSSLTILTTI